MRWRLRQSRIASPIMVGSTKNDSGETSASTPICPELISRSCEAWTGIASQITPARRRVRYSM
jgi:hypothetical protein